jgi:hypothetical protein
MNTTVHEFRAVYPDGELPAPLAEAKLGDVAGHQSAVEVLPGNHERLIAAFISSLL